MNRVQKGQPLRIAATDWNAVTEAVAYVRERQMTFGGEGGGAWLQSGIVRVRNDSAQACSQYDILGIDGVVVDPADNLQEFKARARVCLKGSEPDEQTHLGKFVVLLDAIDVGEIGRAVAGGITVCRLDVQAEGDTHAEIAGDVMTTLKTGTSGSAFILWKKPGTGTQWGVVRLGDNAASGLLWGKAASAWVNAEGNGSYVDVNPCDDKDGLNADTSETVRVYLPRCGSERDPNVPADAVLPYALDASGTAVCVGDYLDEKIGSVKAFSGTLPTVGWQLCDGTNGTPDLRGRFIVGQNPGDEHFGALGGTGGTKKHSHDTHSFTPMDTPGCAGSGWEVPVLMAISFDTDFSHNESEHIPPYYVLAWIMRVA
ncbi:MAG TPA: hypothetical protein PKG77_24495 [Phycisphaerae bacterium]|nr:hypothetical protein [Phycisphaerae bacterium]